MMYLRTAFASPRWPETIDLLPGSFELISFYDATEKRYTKWLHLCGSRSLSTRYLEAST